MTDKKKTTRKQASTHPWWKKITGIADRLRKSDLFEVDLEPAKPKGVSESVLAAAERRMGAPIPPLLRSLHGSVGDVRFEWRIRRGREHELGLDHSSSPSGVLQLVPASELEVTVPGWVCFTNDGSGDGFAFETGGDAVGATITS